MQSRRAQRHSPGSRYVGSNLKAELLYRLAWNGDHAVTCAANLHFDGGEPRLLLQPFGPEVQVEVAVQKLADAADVEEAATSAIADALQRQVHVCLTKVDNDRFRFNFNFNFGLGRVAQGIHGIRQCLGAREARRALASGMLRLKVSSGSVDKKRDASAG